MTKPSHQSQYLPALTGIRALAALLVLGLHTDQNIPAGLPSILPFFARGYLGVDFFFILSGFIITHVYFAAMLRLNRSAVQIFLWHRFVRLYPVHLTVLSGLAVMVILARLDGIALNDPQNWQWKDILWQITLLQAWGVTPNPGWNAPSWSISAEWFAYLLFPLFLPALAKVCHRAMALLIAVAALAMMALLFATADWDLNTWVGAPALARVFGEFLCGAALCRAVVLGGELPYATGDILGTGAFLAFLIGGSLGLSDLGLVALLACTIFGSAMSAGYWARILGSRLLVWLGEISYSVYMVHFSILILIRRVWERLGGAQWQTAGKAFAFLITIALIVAVAAMLFYYVERPARSRLRNQMGAFAPA